MRPIFGIINGHLAGQGSERHFKGKSEGKRFFNFLKFFFNFQGIIQSEFVHKGCTLNQIFFLWILQCVRVSRSQQMVELWSDHQDT
jgi:hypothetical protein